MAVGLEITNDTGNIQVTSEYSNMVLRSKIRKLGKATFTTNGLFYAIKPDVGQICTPYGNNTALSLGNLTAYTFDLPTAADIAAADKLGLEVYKADGTVAFNSNLKYMKVLASSRNNTGTKVVIQESDWGAGLYYYEGFRTTFNFGHPNVAVIFNMGYKVNNIDPDGIQFNLGSACEIKANNDLVIHDFYELAKSIRSTEMMPYSTECSWLVIDTTGL